MDNKIVDKKEEVKNLKEKDYSRKIIIGAIVVGLIILVSVSFAVGVAVGFKKARFSYEWGKHYERNFIGMQDKRAKMDRPEPSDLPMNGLMRKFDGRDFRNAHGLVGTIISIADNKLIVKDQDNKENTVEIKNETIIKSGRNDIKIGDLKINDKIVVMGRPGENGLLSADLIRLFNQNLNN